MLISEQTESTTSRAYLLVWEGLFSTSLFSAPPDAFVTFRWRDIVQLSTITDSAASTCPATFGW